MSAKESTIVKAAQFARKAHEGQQRKYNNAPYITHPVRVAGRVATLDESTVEMVAASFLHDVIEDCGISYAALFDMFGKDVADLVLELTNDKTIQGNRAERKKQNRERFKNASKSAKIIKLVDRIDNLCELDWSDGFSKLYANESILLLNESLTGVNAELENELRDICERILS